MVILSKCKGCNLCTSVQLLSPLNVFQYNILLYSEVHEKKADPKMKGIIFVDFLRRVRLH